MNRWLALALVTLAGCAPPGYQAWYRWDPVAEWQKGAQFTQERCQALLEGAKRHREAGGPVAKELLCLPVGEQPK